MINLARTTLFTLVLLLSGCTYFNSDTHSHAQDNNYLAARSIPPLKIPPGVSSSSFHSEYPVSDRQYPGQSTKVDITPPGL